MKRLSAILIAIVAISLLTAVSAMQLTAAAPPGVRLDSGLTFKEHGVRLAVSPLSQEFTRKITARWGTATNALGDASSYRVRWVMRVAVGGPLTVTERVVPTLSDTLTLLVPIAPDSATVWVAVWARRRGLESRDSVYSTRSFTRADAPPPPPPAVTLDTVVALTVFLPTPTVMTGSQLTACTAYRSAQGRVGLLMAIPSAPPPGAFSPSALVPNYGQCKSLVEARIGPLTGADFFGIGVVGAPPCVYPRGAQPPLGCAQRTGQQQWRGPVRYVGV